MTQPNEEDVIHDVIEWVYDEYLLDIREQGDFSYEPKEGGVLFHPEPEINLNTFVETIGELEDYDVERVPEGIAVYEIKELGSGKYKHKVGTTIGSHVIPLGGVDAPIQEGKPVDDTTEEVLRILGEFYTRSGNQY